MFYTWLDAELLGLSEKKYIKAWNCSIGFLGAFWYLGMGNCDTPNPKAPRVNQKKFFFFFRIEHKKLYKVTFSLF